MPRIERKPPKLEMQVRFLPGDIRNVLAALSDVEPLVEQMFQHRFQSKNELSGHSLGNLILAAMTSLTGDFVHAIQEMSKFLNVRGKVLPAANQSVVAVEYVWNQLKNEKMSKQAIADKHFISVSTLSKYVKLVQTLLE